MGQHAASFHIRRQHHDPHVVFCYRNSGALGPLLSVLLLEQETINMVRCLETLSFLLLDRSNRRACHELGGLDVLLDILRRATDQQVLLCAVGALCSLCKHDVNDKVRIRQVPLVCVSVLSLSFWVRRSDGV